MSSQDHERLLEGTPDPAVPAASPAVSAVIPRPRRTVRATREKAEGARARTRRTPGTTAGAEASTPAPTRAARSESAPAPKTEAGARAKAATAKRTATRSTPAKRTAGPAGAKASAATPTVAGPAAARTVPAQAPTKQKAAPAAAARTPVGKRPAAAAPAGRPRPTPYPRTPVDVPATAAAAAAQGTDPLAGVTLRIVGRHRRPATPHRRPAVLLAAALVGVLGVGSFALVNSSTKAQAGPGTAVSVAHELGLTSHTAAAPAPLVASRQLGLLAASRAHREAEQEAAARAQRVADAKAIEAARPKAVVPVKGARLTSGFGYRWGTLHAGIDLAAPLGTPEYAVMDGVVLKAGPASGFGQAVYIQHANGDVTVYGHMEKILVTTGQVVKAGQEIALLGAEGQATGPHLHLEVHVGGIQGPKIDPIPWLAARGVHV